MKIEGVARKLTLVLAFTALSVFLFTILVSQSGVRAPWKSPYEAYLTLNDAYRLIPNAEVRQAGVVIGSVEDVQYTVTPKGVVSDVRIALDDDRTLNRDARVLQRFKSLANEQYLDVDPGTPKAGVLPSGSRLPVAQIEESAQLDQVLGTFDTATRRSVQTNLDSLGGALEGNGEDLSRLLGSAPPAGEQGRQVLGLLDEQRGQVGSVVHDLAEVLSAFENRTQSVRTLSTQARRAAEAAASRDEALARGIEELPPVLRQAEVTLDGLGDFSDENVPVVRNLTEVTRELTPLLRDLGPAVRDARPLAAELPEAMRRAEPLFAELEGFSTELRPAVVSLDALLRETNPALSYLQQYDRELGAFFANNSSALGKTDKKGNIGRVFGILSPNSFTGLDENQRALLDALFQIGSFDQSRGEDYNAIPKPGTVGNVEEFDGEYPELRPRESYLRSEDQRDSQQPDQQGGQQDQQSSP